MPGFKDRCLVRAFGDEGVLLDLETGSYHRVNRSAMNACVALAEEDDPSSAAVLFAKRSRTSLETAKLAVRSVLDHVDLPSAAREEASISFAAAGTRTVMRVGGRDTLSIDLERSILSGIDPARDARELVLCAIPHLLTARGELVLHASAVRRGKRTIAFCGPTGAGKSTLAEAFAGAGWLPVADDLLLLRVEDSRLFAVADGETRIHASVEDLSGRLEGTQGREAEVGDLSALHEAPAEPLAEVWFIESKSAGPAVLELTRLDPLAAMVAFLDNSFAELGTRDVWRHVFESSYRLSMLVHAERAEIPEGLDRLAAAVAAYSSKIMS